MTQQRRTALKELQKLDVRIQEVRQEIRDFDPLFEEAEEPALKLESELGTAQKRLTEMTLGDVNAAIAEHTRPNALCVVVVATAASMLPKLEGLGWDSVEVVAYDSY